MTEAIVRSFQSGVRYALQSVNRKSSVSTTRACIGKTIPRKFQSKGGVLQELAELRHCIHSKYSLTKTQRARPRCNKRDSNYPGCVPQRNNRLVRSYFYHARACKWRRREDSPRRRIAHEKITRERFIGHTSKFKDEKRFSRF